MKKLIFLTFFLFQSCSSTSSINIKTSPDKAKLKIIRKSGEITELGQSPLKTSIDDLFSGSSYVQLLIEKDSFKSERVVLTRPYFPTDIDLSLNLVGESGGKESAKDLENVSIKIAEIYRKIQNKDLTNAQRELKALQGKFPNLSIINDLLGNISYLSGNLKQAKKYYLKADSIQPNNYERAVMLKKINAKIVE